MYRKTLTILALASAVLISNGAVAAQGFDSIDKNTTEGSFSTDTVYIGVDNKHNSSETTPRGLYRLNLRYPEPDNNTIIVNSVLISMPRFESIFNLTAFNDHGGVKLGFVGAEASHNEGVFFYNTNESNLETVINTSGRDNYYITSFFKDFSDSINVLVYRKEEGERIKRYICSDTSQCQYDSNSDSNINFNDIRKMQASNNGPLVFAIGKKVGEEDSRYRLYKGTKNGVYSGKNEYVFSSITASRKYARAVAYCGSSGGVYYSKDYGETFQQSKGIAACRIIKSSPTGYVVAVSGYSDSSLYFSSDTGENFEKINLNIPAINISDFVIDPTGKRIFFVSRTSPGPKPRTYAMVYNTS